MANTNTLGLPVAVSLDGTEYVALVQGTGSSAVDRRATTAQIGNAATGFIPSSTVLSTSNGISGGGLISSGLTLSLSIATLTAKTAMAVADSFAINDVVDGNLPRQVTFPNAMKAITGLPSSGAINLSADKFIVIKAADGLAYSATASQISLATGNVPAGGTTGQALVKTSNTNYDTQWVTGGTVFSVDVSGGTTGLTTSGGPVTTSGTITLSGTLVPSNGGTGRSSLTSHGVLVGAGTAAVTMLAAASLGTLLTGQGASADPSFNATPTLGVAGTTTGTLSLAGGTSGTATITPQGVAGTPTLTLPNATGTFAVSASSPLAVSATTGNISISSSTGGGAIVLATSPTLVTPTLGVATGTSFNKMAITAPATSSTLAVADGKTLTASNTLTLAGIDATTITFQGTDTYVGRATTDTLTHKTFDTAGTGNSLSIAGVAVTANTGTGAVARSTSPTFVTPALGVATGTSLTLTTGATTGPVLDVETAGPASGNQSANIYLNHINVTSDNGNTGSSTNVADALRVDYSFGGSNTSGARQGIEVLTTLATATSATNSNRNYVGITAFTNAAVSDGGTNTGAGALGAFFGMNAGARAKAGATNLLCVVGIEADVEIANTASVRDRFGFSSVSYGLINAVRYDAAFEVGAALTTIGWNTAFLLNHTSHGLAPLTSTGTVIGTDGSNDTIATGIDLSSYTITGNFLKGPSKFVVTGSGLLGVGTTSPGATIDAGDGSAVSNIRVNGSGSGTAGGGFISVYNNNSPIMLFGNYSAILGGAYDATGLLYSVGDLSFNVGASERLRISTTGLVGIATSVVAGVQLAVGGKIGATGGIGYITGAGSTATQSTNKSTGVTLNNVCGQITMNNASLAGSTTVGFTLTNSTIAATDVVNVSISSAATANSYSIQVDAVAAGSCRISLRNTTASTSLGEALVLNFAVLKSVAA